MLFTSRVSRKTSPKSSWSLWSQSSPPATILYAANWQLFLIHPLTTILKNCQRWHLTHKNIGQISLLAFKVFCNLTLAYLIKLTSLHLLRKTKWISCFFPKFAFFTLSGPSFCSYYHPNPEVIHLQPLRVSSLQDLKIHHRATGSNPKQCIITQVIQIMAYRDLEEGNHWRMWECLEEEVAPKMGSKWQDSKWQK